MRQVLWAALFLPLSVTLLIGQAEWPKPNWEKAEILRCRDLQTVTNYPVQRYEVKLVPGANPQSGEISCRSYLVKPSQHELPLLRDWNVSVYRGTGDDLFGDGNPTLILEGFSGGAHCCYTYQIVDLGEKPRVLPTIRNQSPFYVFKDPVSKRFRIMTSDGAFDSFDGLCHACAPFPRVVLQADAAGLHDVSSQFIDQYDSQIALARAKIADGDIGKFMISDFADAKAVVLDIVFSYLYSGREAQAWQTLDEMWPAADRQRIKKLILKTRANGILSKLGQAAPRTLGVSSAR